MINDIDKQMEDINPEALFIGTGDDRDLHARAIIGYGGQHGSPPVLVYSYERLVETFTEMFSTAEEIDSDQTPEETAVEWLGFNVVCSYVGPGTPIIVNEFEAEDVPRQPVTRFCPGCGRHGTLTKISTVFVEEGPYDGRQYAYEGDAVKYECSACGAQHVDWSSDYDADPEVE